MEAIKKSNGEKVTLTGYTIANGKTYLTFKGAAKNSVLAFEMVETLDGNPITPEMFNVKGKEEKNNTDTLVKIFLSVNNKMNENTTYNTACALVSKINSNGSEFIESLKNSFFKYNKLSEKQAFFLAKEATKQGL